MRRVARWGVTLLLAAWCVLIFTWLIVHWAILPHIEQWRPQIERRASAALGVQVHIGGIDVRSGGWVPAFELRQVVLSDRDGREALRLPRVAAALSPRSLLAFEPRFEQLLIDGAELELRRDASGRLHVAGIAFGGGDGDNDAADWLFSQHELVVRGGRLRWIDEARAAPPLELSDVTLVLRNGARRHALRLDATPPREWGERFSLSGRLRQPLLARSGDWRRWSGTLHAELPRVDVRELRRHAALPFELSEGAGALRAWIELANGTAQAATIDLALTGVAMRLAPEVEPLAFARVEGRLTAMRSDDDIRFTAERFGFTTAEGVEWPAGNAELTLERGEGASPRGGSFSTERLDLALAAGIASKLPLGDALRELLVQTQPRGIVSALAARWDGPLDAPAAYRASARISGLAIAAREADDHPRSAGRPGIDSADVELQAHERGGEATLAVAAGVLHLPGVFEQPAVPLQRLDAKLAWRIDARPDAPPQVELRVDGARFANADTAGELSARWRTGAGAGLARGGRYPGLLDLSARLDRARAVAAARYLPLGIAQHARRYVERAVKGGSATSATFKVKGDLWDFPFFDGGQGELRIAARLRDVVFDYVPSVPGGRGDAAWTSPWPGLTNVSGELLFDRRSMQVRNASARLWGIELMNVSGSIADLVNDPTVAIEGSGRGPLADGLRFVSRSPVGTWTERALAQATGSGTADIRLALKVPLEDASRSSVDGSVMLAGNDVRISPDTPLLGNARGRVDFSQRGFRVVDGAARLAGGEAGFDGGTQPDGSLRFNGQGVASAEGLRAAQEWPLLARVAESLSGRAPYRLALGIVRGAAEVRVDSDLAGMASALPAPLGKRAEAVLPVRYQTTLAAPDGSRDVLRFELGRVVQAEFARDLSGAEPRVLHGGVGVGVGAELPAPAAGVHANVNLATIDADAWQGVAAALFGGALQEGAEAADGSYAPSHVALRADALVAEGRRLTKLVAGLSLVDRTWRASLDADQLHGYAEWRPAAAAAGAGAPGRVYARLTRLALPEAEAQSFESVLLDAPPANVPALDIAVDDFELRGTKLGRLEIEAVNRIEPREWRLAKLALTTPEARFSANGRWADGATKRRRSELDFTLDLADSGAFLARLGTPGAIRGGKGRLQGEIGWDGSPLALDPSSLAGQVNVSIDAGQFLKAEPGVARLLGVLSLQSLPRRLALDFRDVFQEGFAFDNITGDIRIADGVAHTNNLRMRGVQAAVLMEGSADLEREMQDLRVVVVPEINAATASLAYAVINPAIGIGTFLAQLFLRGPLARAATREFHITGPWADPKIESIERRIDTPPLEGEAAAAAPPRPPPQR